MMLRFWFFASTINLEWHSVRVCAPTVRIPTTFSQGRLLAVKNVHRTEKPSLDFVVSEQFGKIIFPLWSIFCQYSYNKTTTESGLKCQFSHHIAVKRMEISLTFLLLFFFNLVPFHQFYILLYHLRVVFLQFYCNFPLQIKYYMQILYMAS